MTRTTEFDARYISNGGKMRRGYHIFDFRADGTTWAATDLTARKWSQVFLADDPIAPAPIDPPPPGPVDPPPKPIDPPPVTGIITPTQFAAALSSAKGGDTLKLGNGIYTMPTAPKFTTPITIKGGTFERLALNGAENITFASTLFDYRFTKGASLQAEPFSVTKSKGIEFSNCMFDGDISLGVSAIDDGFATGRGLSIDASQGIRVQGCTFKTWMRGLVVSRSSQIVVSDNDVSGIRSDGMNFIQVQDVLIDGNHLHDFASAPGSGDHADMIQFWTTGTTIPSTDVTIRDNIFDVAHGTWAQSLFMRNEAVDKGVSTFADMAYRRFLIEGNTIKNAHIHGITLGEADGAIVTGNTLTKAPLNLALKYNADYVTKFGADAGIMHPKINMAAASADVSVSGNTVDGVAG